ncbi:MAG: polyprenol monophosphomannose synthase [Marmoricola sp.]
MNQLAPLTSRVVVIPTYDEAATIGTALDAVLLAVPHVEVLVVDDGSPDGTADVVRAHPAYADQVHLLVRDRKSGLGDAYRAGFAWALRNGYDQIAQMDADLSHPPERLPALFAALGSADVAVGSRYVPGGGVRRWSWRRRTLSRGGNVYVRLVLGIDVHDSTAGFKAFRREALETIEVLASEANGYAFQIENTWQAVRHGMSVVEVPITFTDRVEGTSKMSGPIAREALSLVARWRWDEIRQVDRRTPERGHAVV